MREELSQMRDLAQTYKWEVIPNFDALSILVKMRAHTGDLFIIDVLCENYKEHPPFFEFIDPDTGVRGTPHAYPKGHDSLFHTSGPCICAPFNQKAYKSVVDTGPHPEWSFGDWMTSKANNYDWSPHSNLAGMLLLVQTRISRPEYYQGRMG